MLAYILVIVAVVVLALIAFVASRPPTFRIERSTVLPGDPAVLFPWFNDLRKSQEWSPWTKLDPAATFTFEGAPSGVGAVSAWDGNRNIGAGRQTIVESVAPERVNLRLEFVRPFAAVCDCGFVLKPAAGGTAVTWWMSGRNNFVAKFFCLFMNQDKMVGTSFEEGFANLRARLGAGAA